jgi:hypothetical protein
MTPQAKHKLSSAAESAIINSVPSQEIHLAVLQEVRNINFMH